MKTLIVDERNANKRIDRYITSVIPALSFSLLQKTFRKKDVKVNGVRVKQDHIVLPGDIIELYISDELLEEAVKKNTVLQDRGFDPVYEDENLILVNKKQGIPVHPDKEQASGTLIDNVRTYLRESSSYKPDNSGFQPMLCHRLDRNTGGLVMIARNQATHDVLLEKIETREIKKYYQCLVNGKPARDNATLRAFLFKDESKSRVYINDRRTTGSLEIITKYRLLDYNRKLDISRLEVELVTGRTHQIRAHLAYIGHPVIGDGKYGSNAVNRRLGIKQQALWAYKLQFQFSDAGHLNYLKDRTFEVPPEFNIRHR